MSHSPEFEAAAQAICDAMLTTALGLMRDGHAPGAVMWAMASALGNVAAVCTEPEKMATVLSYLDRAMGAAAQKKALQLQPPAGTA